MKIVITGAQGVGKTTLIKSIEKSGYIQGYKYIREIVRSLVIKDGIKVNKSFDFPSQMAIFNKHKDNALQIDKFISDRSAIDAFVYTTWHLQKGNMTQQEFDSFKSVFEQTVTLYDKVFFIPIEFTIKKDGFRSTDKDFQEEISQLFINIFHEYEINYGILSGSLKERLSTFQMSI